MRDLVEKLLRSNSSKRLGVNGALEIKQHPWFGGLEWDEVEGRMLKMPDIEETKGKTIKQEFFQEEAPSEK